MKSRIFLVCILLSLLKAISYSASVDTVTINSHKMDIVHRAIIVMPDSYGEEDMPVVYLLHGFSDNYRTWFEKSDLKFHADKYKMIIVCPDGGYAGWYLDSPLNENSQYESYIAEDVVNYVDENYRTLAQAEYRYLCGLSMGGHGALRLLCRHPDRFGAAGSMSGLMELSSFKNEYRISDLIGPYDEFRDRWYQYACLNLVKNLVGLNKGIFIDCGLSDDFIEGNRRIHDRLIELKIPHDYIERPGGHSWSYWIDALEYHLLFFKKMQPIHSD